MNSTAMWRGWRPLHAWTRRRRALVAATLALFAALLSGAACFFTDAGGAQAARDALTQSEVQLADARRTLARLPALRREAEGWPHGAGAQRTSQTNTHADDIHGVSQLAAQAGLVLIALEPAAPGGAKAQAFRATKLAAQGGFPQLRAFLEGLAEWPELAVPADIVVKRSGGLLAIAATLHVFDGLPAVAIESAEDAEPGDAARDPFASRFALTAGGAAAPGLAGGPGVQGVQGDRALRLAGTLTERGRVLALVETAEGTLAVQPGASLAGGRVTGVGAERVVLSVDGATQVLNWAEDSR